MTLIVATTVDRGNTDGCVVNVTKQDVAGISLAQSSETLKIKSTLTLKPVISPTNASNQTIIWSSGNENVAKVSDAGVVTAIASGTSGIMGRTVDGNYLVYCIVYVPQVVDSITLSQNSIKYDLGDAAVTLSAKLMPDNLSIKEVTWTSSNYSIANVDSNGKVTPMSGGTATITVTSIYDKTKKATCSVTVTGVAMDLKVHATGITLSSHQISSVAGTTFYIKVGYSP